ncbi:AP2-like ethylene-responsive transcription factor [Actinidia chinensis var. chinensis]|uniref:AP2-like ethylene-responsive transcription factor n=1 Tax=Actinidia chinensis var. chinensis TaxID=1590841 RepID=A0A2R6Q8N9_ACTCC|nr:AP2-like ethylene-responsive transcription factor [Actinidia chinensis var. chinensis]
MDSSQNWLGFSLSNHHMPSDSSHLCLFQAFNANHPSGGVDRVSEDHQDPSSGAITDLSIFTGGPKLENFLGGGGAEDVCQFTGTTPATNVSQTEIYDSELKTIAASFLRAFSTEQADGQKMLAVPSKKPVDTFGQRTSIYRGVTRHRWTGRFEAHLWDNSCRREGQSRKGRQGGYDKEEKAGRAYDLAALKYWGPNTTTNFQVSNYEQELEEMKNMTRQEFVASLRRKSSGFSRGASIYRGVTRHHQHGRWQARIGRVAGNKDLYLGTFSTQEEAAEAYDIAAIKFRGQNAVTNFDMSRYDVKSIASSNLPIGGITENSKTSSNSASNKNSIDGVKLDHRYLSSASSSVTFALQPPTSSLSLGLPIKQDTTDNYWSILGYHNNPSLNSTPENQASSAAPLFQAPTSGGTSSFQLGTAPYSMDLSTNNNINNNNGLLNGGTVYLQQQSIGNSSGIAFATPIALSSNGNSNEGGSFGNWVHSFQSAKPNLSVFCTPIFGME